MRHATITDVWMFYAVFEHYGNEKILMIYARVLKKGALRR